MKGIGQIPTVALIALLTLLGLAGLIQASQEGTMVGPPPSLDEGLSASQSTDKRAQQEFPVPYTPLPKTITPCRTRKGLSRELQEA